MKVTTLQRFESKFKKNTEITSPHVNSPCWIWIAGKDRDGYGRFKDIPAHRASYFLYKNENPKTLFVCHHCDNPSCVNPDHLFLGTTQENTQDKVRKGRCPKPMLGKKHSKESKEKNRLSHLGRIGSVGEKNPRAKLTAKIVSEIRIVYSTTNVTQKYLAEKYKVSYSLVNMIVKNKIWKSV